MTNDKLVSVIIPCYNHEKYIYKAIQSILNQTYTNIEVLVADDCSSDSSVNEINRIQDPRLKKFFFTENHGTIYTLNYLIKQCSGQYIAALGSDDCFAPDKIEKQLLVFKTNPSLGAVFTWAEIIDENDKPYSGDDFKPAVFEQENRTQGQWLRFFFEHGNRLCHPSALVKTSVYEDIGLYRTPYRQLHDFELWVRMLLKYPIHVIPERLTYYRRENQCISVSASTQINITRTYNEYSSIFLWLFKTMEDDLFFDSFGDLIDSDCAKNSESLLIEKYKILCQYTFGGCAVRNASTAFFIDCIEGSDYFKNNPDKAAELLKHFYEDTAQHGIDYPDTVLLRERCAQLENTINGMLASKSWKITKPLRFIIALINNLLTFFKKGV